MKTQINNLVLGNTHIGIHGRVGSTTEERQRIAESVKRENPEGMIIMFMGRKIELDSISSISGKSRIYSGVFPIDLYRKKWGNFGIPQKEPQAMIIIDDNMKVTVRTNSKFKNSGKHCYQIINESDIMIL
jgi:hypothetical protein